MPRLYHSPSSIALGDEDHEGCEFAWAQCYLLGIRSPSVVWEDIASGKVTVLPRGAQPSGHDECTPGQRSAALGVAVHEVGETWYLGGEPDWRTLPAQVYKSGLHLIPHRDECDVIETEHGVGTIPIPQEKPRDPETALAFIGVMFAGTRDLVVQTSGRWLLIDYKSTSNVARYAKTSAELVEDAQACLYAYDVMTRYGLSEIACRWLYLETGPKRYAKAVDFTITLRQACRVLTKAALLAKHLDALTVETANKNISACGRYGGCTYHESMGGNCDARRLISTLVRRKEPDMALTEEKRKEYLERARSRREGGAAKTQDTAATTEVSAPKTRAKKTETPPADTPAPKADLSAVLALQSEIEAAHEAVTEATAKYEEATTAAEEARERLDVATETENAVVAKLRAALG